MLHMCAVCKLRKISISQSSTKASPLPTALVMVARSSVYCPTDEDVKRLYGTQLLLSDVSELHETTVSEVVKTPDFQSGNLGIGAYIHRTNGTVGQ